MQKRNVIAATLVVSVLSLMGCKESVVNALQVPQIAIATAVYSNGLNAITSSDTVTIAATFTHVSENTLADTTGSSTNPPTGIKVSRTGTVDCSDIHLSDVTNLAATVNISGCSGDGKITVQFLADTLTSTTFIKNKASALTVIVVDNTRPTATLNVTYPNVGTSDGANIVTATFSEAVQSLSATNSQGEFTVSGCTVSNPNLLVTSVLNGSGKTVAVATLSGGHCNDSDLITVELNLDKITDLAGNDGISSDNQQINYNITSRAVAALASVAYPGSQTALGRTGVATSALSFVNAVSTTLTTSSGNAATPPAGLTAVVTGSADCTIDILSPSITGASIRLSACTGQGSIAITANAGIASSATTTVNAASNSQSFMIDATTPTATLAVTNNHAGTAAAANTVTATFNKLITAIPANNSTGAFTITGCATNPIMTVVMSTNGSGNSVATGTLAGGICSDLATVSTSLDLTKVTDTVGNVGESSDNPLPVTYSIDLSNASASFASVDYGGGSYADIATPAIVRLTWANTASTALSNGSGSSTLPPAGITVTSIVPDAECDIAVSGSTVSGATITFSNCTGAGSIDFQVEANLATSPGGHKNIASPGTPVTIHVSN